MLMQEFGLYREVIGHPDGTAFANALYSVVFGIKPCRTKHFNGLTLIDAIPANVE